MVSKTIPASSNSNLACCILRSVYTYQTDHVNFMFYKQDTTFQQQDILASTRLWNWYLAIFGGNGCGNMSSLMFNFVIYVRAQKTLGINHMVSCNLCLFQSAHGHLYLWILLRIFQNHQVQTLFLLSLIASPRWLISCHATRQLLVRKLHDFSSIIFIDTMDFQMTSYQIEVHNLFQNSGDLYLGF